MSNQILTIPLEYIEHFPFVQLKPECIRNISLSQLSDMDNKIKDYGITLFLNQIQALQHYKILFPARERLAVGESIVYAYVILDNGVGLSTLMNAIVNRDQIRFQLNIVYITSHSRILESTDVICTLHKDGETNSIVRYQFSSIEKRKGDWCFTTLEVADNMDYPDNSAYQNNNVIILEEEVIPIESQELVYLNSCTRIHFPELFPRIYKAFDTKDEDLLEECCSDYNRLLVRNARLENENARLIAEVMSARYRIGEVNKFIETLQSQLAQLQTTSTTSTTRIITTKNNIS